MSDFENEFYKSFFRNIRNEKFLKINASAQQEKALRDMRQYGESHGLYDVSVLELIEGFVRNRRELSEELIHDLVSTANFHVGGDYNYLFKMLKDKYLTK
ncbi:hypothetical protein NU10_02055 [Flavobacterium dauae]|uniref:hypothetical protein n=1 Tax=Flavobacterium dauae TaxID=1563479 RepID=UPI00101B4845|nr:hypothetical protein [Flavobacterium dauae]WLD24205.1 hypothetical protein NU10_02055 [Flavobacterium dauae]